MAIYNGRILMRKGLEADFDASKLMPGEWALSTDKGIIRICLEAGKVIRMATYEAFEEDMKQVEAILLECQSIEEAVRRINTEVNNKLNACAEYVQQAKGYSEQAKQYRDEALQFRNEAEQFAPEGYAELKEKVNENTFKIDTVIEKADLGIKETASGEEIHLTDSAEGKAVEFALFGKARQNTTSGKNLLENTAETVTNNGITYTTNSDKSISVVGKISTDATEDSSIIVGDFIAQNSGIVKLSGSLDDYAHLYAYNMTLSQRPYKDATKTDLQTLDQNKTNKEVSFYTEKWETYRIRCRVFRTVTENVNAIVYPMVSADGGEYEPFTNGASPNPSYPQEIEVSGESYNLLPYPYQEGTKTSNAVTFTSEDGIVTVNGTATANASFICANYSTLKSILSNGEKYVLSGCPENGSNNTYKFQLWTNKGSYMDVGNGIEFTFDDSISDGNIAISILSGTKADNLTFKPMIRKADAPNDRYMPYGKGSVEVKSVGKNLLKNNAISKTINGVTFTVNSDGSVTVNGTSSGGSSFVLNNKPNLKKGRKYVVSNGIGIGKNPFLTNTVRYSNGTISYDGLTTADIPRSTLLYDDTIESIEESRLFVANGVTVNNVTVYPMIRYADITDDTYEPYKETLSAIPTENGLAGIKVSSNGNYTDQNGQQWICDEVVKYADGSGAYIQRIGKERLQTIESSYPSTEGNLIGIISTNAKNVSNNNVVGNIISNMYSTTTANIQYTTNMSAICVMNKSGVAKIGISNKDVSTIDELTAFLNENEVIALYELAEPIETPLTAEEIAEISTFYPVTNISNDFECGMKVKYNADSKNYIDKQLAEMERAREQAMMSMFLLLPEETQATMIENDVNNLLTESEI